MPPTSHTSILAGNEPVIDEGTTGRFVFISVQATDEATDKSTRRRARSHAVTKALETKRKLQQDSMDNFRVTTLKDSLTSQRRKNKRTHTRSLVVSPWSPPAGILDPFQTLPGDSSRLQTLLGNHKARKAPEPVFSVAEELAFQDFGSVFRTGLVDPALLNAVMLSLAFAVTGGIIDQECLSYQGRAISCIREKMSVLDDAASETTIGAILLLAGVQAHLRLTPQVQLHMGAVKLLLDTCQSKGVPLTDGIKRAILWQDLNSSILAGSSRIVDHQTFDELRWTRDQLPPSYFRLPPGFQKLSYLLSHEFMEVLEDVHALQCVREIPRFTDRNLMQMALINNHTASIQSRLVNLPNTTCFLECCHLAAYLCSVMLCCTAWCALAIPSHVCSQLLDRLQQANDDPIWDEHPTLLLWLLYIGGAFAPTVAVRSDYIALIRLNYANRFGGLYRSWPELLEILKQFTWSEKAFIPHVKMLRKETMI